MQFFCSIVINSRCAQPNIHELGLTVLTQWMGLFSSARPARRIRVRNAGRVALPMVTAILSTNLTPRIARSSGTKSFGQRWWEQRVELQAKVANRPQPLTCCHRHPRPDPLAIEQMEGLRPEDILRPVVE